MPSGSQKQHHCSLSALGPPVFIQQEEGYDLLRRDAYGDHQFQHLFLFLLSLYLKSLGGGDMPDESGPLEALAKIAGNPVIFSKGMLPRCGGALFLLCCFLKAFILV